MRCTILFDNEVAQGLEPGWGFSCLVQAHGKNVLFDTGSDGKVLLRNIRKLGIRIEDIDCVFLSHGDWDHQDGLESFLDEMGALPVYAPQSACAPLSKMTKGKAEIIPISEPKEILPGLFTTGEMGGTEQSLAVRTSKGLVLITGCAHPGLDKMLEMAAGFGEVYGVIGGFHGFADLEKLKGLRLIMPCHCSESKDKIAKRFPDATVPCRAGAVMEVD